jgi:RNA polymerase sigma factor (TIGR02999 family)
MSELSGAMENPAKGSASPRPKTKLNDSDLLQILYETVIPHLRRKVAGASWGLAAESTTDLIHDAIGRLADSEDAFQGSTSAEALMYMAQVVRHLAVTKRRAAQAQKRGGGGIRKELDQLPAQGPSPLDLLDLNDRLTMLAARQPRLAQIVELRIFGALAANEVAELLGLSQAEVYRMLRQAMNWLRHGGE